MRPQKENKDVDDMKKTKAKNNTFDKTRADRIEMHINCKYCRSTHKPHGCPVYGRDCSGFGTQSLSVGLQEPENKEVAPEIQKLTWMLHANTKETHAVMAT